ncbi:phosphoglycerate kinase [Thermodesulfobacteriota bacterium]
MNKKCIKDIDIKDKRVLIRVDFNVPLNDQGEISDDNRIRAALPTIEYGIDNGAKVILMSHLGRPKGEVRDEMRLDPVAGKLEELLDRPVNKLDDCIGANVEDAVAGATSGEIILLENLRFHNEETKNDPGFARQLAAHGEIFVNDAFGTCHRAHASTEGVTHYLESAAGFLVEKEIEYFEKINSSPERPFVLILGGAKVSDKLPLIKNMLSKVDCIIIGGAMAYTFLKVKGAAIGSSRYEEEISPIAKDVIEGAGDVELLFPVDHIVCDDIQDPSKILVTKDENIEEGYTGVDIGPKSIELFLAKLKNAKTVVWNGPMGMFEKDDFARGTKMLAEGIAASPAVSVIGGGDSAAAAKKFGLEEKFSHVSTGGGASLEYLEGKVLPGIAALDDKQ